jgi:hypothetical protein
MGATSPYIYIYYGNLDLLIRMIVVWVGMYRWIVFLLLIQ